MCVPLMQELWQTYVWYVCPLLHLAIYDVSMNLFCWPPSVDNFNILPGFLWQPLLRTSLPKTGPLRFGLENQFPLNFAHEFILVQK